jgi:hypothetical protein
VSTPTATGYADEDARQAFRAAVQADASPRQLAQLYDAWCAAYRAAVNTEDGKITSHREAYRARAEQWSRLWNHAGMLGWRREDGVRRRNLSEPEFRSQDAAREQWKADASEFTGTGVTQVNGDLLGPPPQPGPMLQVRYPVQPADYQTEVHRAATSA